MKAHIEAWFTGEPGKAPAWKFNSASAAVILPSLVQPIFTLTLAPGVGPVPRNTSSRVITIFTGRLDLRDSAIASASL